MIRLLIVDDSTPVVDKDQLPRTISEELGWHVTTARCPDELPTLLDGDAAFRLAMVDLSYANSALNGLDALLTLHDGWAPVDPVLQPLLPSQRSPWRSLDGYGRLVGHAGHAKLWRALIELDEEPSYRELAAHTGLSISAVRNYRSELLDHLALHHLDAPRMREMQRFAKRCRPLLAPHIRVKLGASSV